MLERCGSSPSVIAERSSAAAERSPSGKSPIGRPSSHVAAVFRSAALFAEAACFALSAWYDCAITAYPPSRST